MRAALLPAGADPFLNAWWLRHFERWSDEVDELRMQVSGGEDDGYLRSIAGPKVILTFTPRMEHGTAIGRLIDETDADLVMLCEDDAFVRRKYAVDEAFKAIENGGYDIVGCPRASMSPDLATETRGKFGNMTTSVGEEGPAFWPCFFFGRRSDLLDTDRHFGAALWKPGETVPGTDYVARVDTAGDTFTGTSFQLRRKGLRVHVEAQYRANLSKMVDWKNQDIPWFHVGSLSSGYGYYFLVDMSEEDRDRHADSIRNDQHDWQKRVAWWQKVTETDDLPELRDAYITAVDEFVDRADIKRAEVQTWRHVFDSLWT